MAPSTAAAVTATLIVLSIACLASAQSSDSTNVTWHGFTIVSNVTGHLYMSKDACEIQDLLKSSSPDFAAAQAIYLDGSNSVRTDGITTRFLASWTAGGHATDHPYFANASALYNDTNWAGAAMDAAIEEEDAAWAITLAKLQIPLIYALAELEGVSHEIDPNGTTVTASGAPHALDEAFGAYAGIASECAPWGYAERAAKAFGTRASCTMSKANEALVAAFIQAQAATLSGNIESYREARVIIERNVQVSLVQNTIMATKKAEKAWFELQKVSKSKKAAKRAELHMKHSEAVAVASALAPFIYAHDEASAEELMELVTAEVYGDYSQEVHQALRAAYVHLGITADMIGTYGATDNACRKLARKI